MPQSVVVTIHDDDEHLFPCAAGRRLRLHPQGTGARADHRAAAAHQPGRAAAVAVDRAPRHGLLHRKSRRGRDDMIPIVSSPTARPKCCCAWPRASRCRRSACSSAVSAHHRRLRQADLPQAQRELARAEAALEAAAPPVCSGAAAIGWLSPDNRWRIGRIRRKDGARRRQRRRLRSRRADEHVLQPARHRRARRCC